MYLDFYLAFAGFYTIYCVLLSHSTFSVQNSFRLKNRKPAVQFGKQRVAKPITNRLTLWHCYAVVFSLYFWRPRALDVGRHSKFMLIDWLNMYDRKRVQTSRFAYECKTDKKDISCLRNSCWGDNAWCHDSCLLHLTKVRSANTVDAVETSESSRSRYTKHWRGMPQCTVGGSSQRSVDRRLGVCPVVKSTAGMLQTRNSSGDEIANVNFLCDDIVHALKIQ